MYGEFVKERRTNKGIGLREFCRAIGVDASNWSKVERGLLAPPQDDGKLKEIAGVLGVEIDSAEYLEMKDLASVSAGLIPQDIMSDESVLNSLPVLFRTLRSDKPTSEELDELISMIRKGS